jgi:hypothetical protein
MLCILKDTIIEQFGEDVYNDLDIIRNWRNKVVHPSQEKPDECSALRVIVKAELFFELNARHYPVMLALNIFSKMRRWLSR